MQRYKVPKVNLTLEIWQTESTNKVALITQGLQEELKILLEMLGECEIAYNQYTSSCMHYIEAEKEELKKILFLLIDKDSLEKLEMMRGLIPQCIRIEQKGSLILPK